MCSLKKAKSYSSFFPFSSVQKEQIQMGSDTSVTAVVHGKKEKEGTSNLPGRSSYIRKSWL